MPWGFFKKRKKEQEDALHYDPTSIQITDMRKGFMLEYDFKTWEAKEEYEYDWGNEYFTYEYKLVAADDTIYLYVEDGDELVLVVNRKITFALLDESIEEAIRKSGKPPKKLEWEGVTYFRESERPGFCKEVDAAGVSDEFVAWEYIDETERRVFTIEQWGDDDFSAATGIIVNEREFSNILPAS